LGKANYILLGACEDQNGVRSLLVEVEPDGVAYLDINADAVRQGDIVPDRPIRVRARLQFNPTVEIRICVRARARGEE